MTLAALFSNRFRLAACLSARATRPRLRADTQVAAMAAFAKSWRWEVKLRWPLLPVVLTSGNPCERAGDLPPGVGYVPKPWRPLDVLIAAEEALASARHR